MDVKLMKPNTILLTYILAIAFLAYAPFTAKAEPIDSIYNDEVFIVKGELEQIKVYSLTRLSITDPDVADIVDANDSEILIVGRDVGQSALFVWDDHGKRSVMINVLSQDLDIVKKRISRLLDKAEIKNVELEENKKEGKVVLSGKVPEYLQDVYEQIVEPFDDDIINLVRVETVEDLVQIDLQITELNTTLTKSLGFDWFAAGPPDDDGIAVKGPLQINYGETVPSFDGSVGDFFKIGDFRRANAIVATVNALIEEGKGRILSQPKLVVLSGEEASFLVGGEIPIRTTTSTGSSIQENVLFKEYGVGMTITPIVRKEKIDVILSLEISDVDSANKVGDDVAFITRSASTQLFLDDGQTIVLAGLIRHNESETVKRVPFISRIPIAGLLFRSKATPTPNQETELVISLTPHRIDTNVNADRSDGDAMRVSDDERMDIMDDEEIFSTLEDMDLTMSNDPETGSLDAQFDALGSNTPVEMAEYIQTVQKQISEAVIYPEEAESQGLEGTVKLGLHILKDGSLAFALVKESSGHEIFDDYALATANNVAPYSNFPGASDLEELEVTIPIVYSLKGN